MTGGVWTPGQVLLRSLVALGPMIALLTAGLVGHPPPVWLLLVTLALALGFAWQPGSVLGTTVLIVVLAWWALATEDVLQAETLAAAAGLLVSHVAAVLASYGPAALPIDPALARLWALRGVLVFSAAPLTWVVATALRGGPDIEGVWVVGVVVAVGAVTLAGLALTGRETVDAD